MRSSSTSRRCRRHSQQTRHEHAVGISDVVAKRSAAGESKANVESARGRECGHGSGFQTQASIPSPLRLVDDVLQQVRGDAFATMCWRSAHGFDFRVFAIQFEECATSQQSGPIGYAPEGDLGTAQRLDIQRVNAFGRRMQRHVIEVFSEQPRYRCTARIVDRNVQDAASGVARHETYHSCGAAEHARVAT